MPSHYTLRMQFGPHQDAAAVERQLLALVRSAPVDEIMFFFFAEEQNDGHEPLERIQLWLDRSRPYREALAAEGVTVSANPWHTLLHADRARTLKIGQSWQTLVDPKGRAAEAQVCPLDPGWRAYYEETLKRYAREDFRVIWIDDDIRLHNHEPLEWGGCWCPLHVEEFSRRSGASATREEIVEKCTAPGTPHSWREIWMDMNEQIYFDMISRWRTIVEAGGSRLGLMSSLPEAHAAEGRRWERWWKAFGGEKPPIHRPHFCAYLEETGDYLTHSIALLDQNRCVQPDGVESGPEIDNGPYGAWNRSFRQTFAQLALAHILGSTNLNISLYDFLGNNFDNEPARAESLRDWRGALDRLADEFPMTMRSAGVGVPWSQDMSRHIRTEKQGDWKNLECPSRGWARWLMSAGHAVTMNPSETVNALGGPMVWSFSQEDILEWLSGAVLIDGPAAAIIIERGLGDFIGFEDGGLVRQEDFLYSIEGCIDKEFAIRRGAQMSLNWHPYARRLFQGSLLAAARIVSDLRSPTQKIFGHGEVVFENELGGRVAVVPWTANADVLMNAERAAQIRKTLDWLDPTHAHASTSGGAWLVPQFLTDGSTWRGVVWNASSDDISEFAVRPPSEMGAVTSVTHFNAHGEMFEGKISDGVVTLPHPMHQWEFVVLS